MWPQLPPIAPARLQALGLQRSSDGALVPLKAPRSRRPRELELVEQMALMRWAKGMESELDALRWLHASANGGARSKAVASKLKASGVKRGVPDLSLPVPSRGYHGLYIELKSSQALPSDQKPRPEQTAWMSHLTRAGYRAVVIVGWEKARDEILDYLIGGV